MKILTLYIALGLRKSIANHQSSIVRREIKTNRVTLFMSCFFPFIKAAKGAESKGEDGTAEAKGSEETPGEAKGSDGTTEDTGGGTKEDTGGTSQDPEGAKQEGENQPKNEEEAEGCCCILI